MPVDVRRPSVSDILQDGTKICSVVNNGDLNVTKRKEPFFFGRTQSKQQHNSWRK